MTWHRATHYTDKSCVKSTTHTWWPDTELHTTQADSVLTTKPTPSNLTHRATHYTDKSCVKSTAHTWWPDTELHTTQADSVLTTKPTPGDLTQRATHYTDPVLTTKPAPDDLTQRATHYTGRSCVESKAHTWWADTELHHTWWPDTKSYTLHRSCVESKAHTWWPDTESYTIHRQILCWEQSPHLVTWHRATPHLMTWHTKLHTTQADPVLTTKATPGDLTQRARYTTQILYWEQSPHLMTWHTELHTTDRSCVDNKAHTWWPDTKLHTIQTDPVLTKPTPGDLTQSYTTPDDLTHKATHCTGRSCVDNKAHTWWPDTELHHTWWPDTQSYTLHRQILCWQQSPHLVTWQKELHHTWWPDTESYTLHRQILCSPHLVTWHRELYTTQADPV